MKKFIKKIMNSNLITRALYKLLLAIKYYGVVPAAKKIQRKFKILFGIQFNPYIYAGRSKAELNKQSREEFDKKIKFSILVPLYNTKIKFLTEMIDSVMAQTYPNWELCLTNGSSDENTHVEEICKEYAERDSRIKYKKLEKNRGIAGNTNACLELATGDYISFLDHDDLLTPDALYEMMIAICEHSAEFIYSDEDKTNAKTKKYFDHAFKPDFAPDYIRGSNYICHFVSVSRKIVDKIGLINDGFEGAQDYDFVLRATEQTTKIYHIPRVLYHWRAHEESTALNFESKNYAIESGKKSVERHLERIGLPGEVEALPVPGTYRINYELKEKPLISIIIPNMDHKEDLQRCIDSILVKTTYINYEIIIVENNSTTEEIFEYYKTLEQNENIKVIKYEEDFNFSKINNIATGHANGKYIIFLNNDTEVITDCWIEEMLMYAQRDDVGIVGAKLYYTDLTIQHAGVIVGLHHIACHAHYREYSKGDFGYSYRLNLVQNFSAVTAACMMIKKDLFLELGGFNEEMAVAYNDSDLCMKVREKGLLIVWTPFAELYHHEWTTRGENNTPEKLEREMQENSMFLNKWKHYWVNGDPYYNVNFSFFNANFVL